MQAYHWFGIFMQNGGSPTLTSGRSAVIIFRAELRNIRTALNSVAILLQRVSLILKSVTEVLQSAVASLNRFPAILPAVGRVQIN